METEHFLEIREIQRRQMLALEKIANCLIQISRDKSPDYHYPLESFPHFDWKSIDAIVERFDSDGAAVVNWNGQQYIRRSPSNKYEPAIWFSRCIKKNADGKNEYERLITFKSISDSEIEPISEKVTRIIDNRTRK